MVAISAWSAASAPVQRVLDALGPGRHRRHLLGHGVLFLLEAPSTLDQRGVGRVDSLEPREDAALLLALGQPFAAGDQGVPRAIDVLDLEQGGEEGHVKSLSRSPAGPAQVRVTLRPIGP